MSRGGAVVISACGLVFLQWLDGIIGGWFNSKSVHTLGCWINLFVAARGSGFVQRRMV